MLPPLRLNVNSPFTGPTSLAFGVVATIDTIGGSSAILTVAARRADVVGGTDWIVRITVSPPFDQVVLAGR